MDDYLSSLKGSKVKTLQELVDWNTAHADEALTKGTVYSEITVIVIITGIQSILFRTSWNKVLTSTAPQRLVRSL